MDEHDDDLMSEVHEGEDLETDTFLDMEDELDQLNGDDADVEDDDADEDKSEM